MAWINFICYHLFFVDMLHASHLNLWKFVLCFQRLIDFCKQSIWIQFLNEVKRKFYLTKKVSSNELYNQCSYKWSSKDLSTFQQNKSYLTFKKFSYIFFQNILLQIYNQNTSEVHFFALSDLETSSSIQCYGKRALKYHQENLSMLWCDKYQIYFWG